MSLRPSPLTVAALAEHKHLPASYLHELGLEDGPGGVRIPYRDLDGRLIASKLRSALKACEGSFWQRGVGLAAYGQWKLPEFAGKPFLILVEGESDCWALWHYGVPALGIPGASAPHTLTAELLGDFPQLFVHREPDRGGDIFVDGVLRRLNRLAWPGRAYEIHLPQGTKDPSDLHIQAPAEFLKTLEMAMVSAKPLSIAGVMGMVAPREDKPAGGAEVPRLAPGASDATAAKLPRPHSICVANVVREEVDWLWPRRVPLGKLTILDGDPGLGKSTLALDLAARLSRGQAMPSERADSAHPPAATVLMSAEDGLGDTIRPRLEAAHADLAKVHVLDSVPGEKAMRPPALPDDLPYLEGLVRSVDARLVIIDPLMAFLSEHVNAHNDQSVRRTLMPLARLAEATGAAVLVLRHLNKNMQGSALYRGGGSIGLIGAARSGLLVAADPDDASGRVLAVTKANLALKPPSLRFRVLVKDKASVLEWNGESDFSPDQLLRLPEGDAGSLDEAILFLSTILAKGAQPVAQVLAQAAPLGLSERTLARARRQLGVKAMGEHDPYGRIRCWHWHLPGVRASTPLLDAVAEATDSSIEEMAGPPDVLPFVPPLGDPNAAPC